MGSFLTRHSFACRTAIAASFLASCATSFAGFFDSLGSGSTRKVKVTVVRAPEAASIMQFKSLAIGNVSGYGANIVASEIESILTNAKLKDRPLFTFTGRGTNTGADGIISVDIATSGIKEGRYSESRSECTRRKKSSGSENFLEKLLTEAQCESGHTRNFQVECTSRRADLVASIKIAKKSGQVVFSDAIVRKVEDKGCSDANKPLADGGQLMARAQAEAIERIRALLSPTVTQMDIELMPPDVTDEGDRKRFDGALRFAEESRMDRACETLRELQDRHGRASLALNYDLGVCEEADGNAWGADEYFKKADRLTSEPNKLITEALARSQAGIKQAMAQGRQAPPGPPSQAKSSPNASVAAPSPISVQPFTGGIISPENLLEDKRVALVIGNTKYRSVSPLPNATNDVEDIAAQLRKLKFDVILRTNATWDAMDSGISEFTRRLKPNGVSLFYYAGHGAQVKDQNYLLPIDLDLKSVSADMDKDAKERILRKQTISLNDLMERLGRTNSAFNIVILDACRDDPIEQRSRSLRRTRSAGDQVSGGLARMDAPKGSYIAFSTKPGDFASDGAEGNRNSPFAEGLIKALAVPNLKLEDVMKKTRSFVDQATNGQQTPWDNSSLVGDFFFSASQVAAVAPTPAIPPPASLSPAKTSRTTTPPATPPVQTPAPESKPAPAEVAAAAAPTAKAAASTREPGEKRPKEFCADRPNFISRNLCETRQCKQAEWQSDPDCEKYREKNF